MTRPLSLTIPHALGQTEARRRLDDGFAQLARQMPGGLGEIEKNWKDNRLYFSAAVMGQAVSGHLDVTDEAVDVVLHLPGMLGMLAGRIAERLRREGQILLEKK